MGVNCPVCNKELAKLSDRHYHCACGVCLYKGLQLTWHQHGEIEACLETCQKDPYFKTGGLAWTT